MKVVYDGVSGQVREWRRDDGQQQVVLPRSDQGRRSKPRIRFRIKQNWFFISV